MTTSNLNLTALLGARICHDLISPVGAISNGMELLSMSGNADGPEAELIAQSVENANARLRLYRLAFGTATPDQGISARQLAEILAAFYAEPGLSVRFEYDKDLTRPQARLLLLLVLCCETAMARRGEILITDATTLTCFGDREPADHPYWAPLITGAGWPQDLRSADVHFPLAQQALQQAGLRLELDRQDGQTRFSLHPEGDILPITRAPRHSLQQGI